MKRLIFFSFLAASLLLTISCQKDENQIQNESTNKNIKTDPISWTCYYDGSPIINFNGSLNYVVSLTDFQTNTIYCFTSDQLFYQWASNQNYIINGRRLDLADMDTRLNSIYTYAMTTGADDYYEQTGQIRADVQIMIDELQNKYSNQNEPKAFLWHDLYDNPMYSTLIWSSGLGFAPSLNNARNKTESLKLYAASLSCMVGCDYKWFGGAKRYFVGFGYHQTEDLNAPYFNFANKMESYLAIY